MDPRRPSRRQADVRILKEKKLNEEPIYDRAEAIERLAGDAALFAEMAAMFIAESPRYCQDLVSALAVRDAPALSRHAHTMKSLLATFSCEPGRDRAQRLEEIAARGDLAAATPLVEQVVADAGRLATALAADGAR